MPTVNRGNVHVTLRPARQRHSLVSRQLVTPPRHRPLIDTRTIIIVAVLRL